MRARPTTWGPITTVTVAVGALVLLLQCPLWVRDALALLAALGLVSLAEEQRLATAKRWREALSAHQIPVTKAATEYMRWDVREFERALAGERKLDAWRLEMLPVEVRQTYALLTLRDLGVPEVFRTFLRVHPVLESMKERA